MTGNGIGIEKVHVLVKIMQNMLVYIEQWQSDKKMLINCKRYTFLTFDHVSKSCAHPLCYIQKANFFVYKR